MSAWVILILFAHVLQYAAPSMSVHDLLHLAVEKQQNGHVEDAQRLYHAVLEVDRDNPDALHLLGLLEHGAGREREGIELVRRAITRSNELGRNDPMFYSNLGELLRSKGDTPEAAVVLHEGHKRYPDALSIAYNLAAVKQDQGDATAQEELLEYVIRGDPSHWNAMLNLAALAYRTGEFERARSLYSNAVELSGGDKDAVMGRGLAEYRLGLLKEAYSTFDLVLKMDPTDSTAVLNMAAMLQVDGRFGEALELYDSWLRTEPDNVHMLNNQAGILMNIGCEDEAKQHFERALSLQPNCTECIFNLAALHLEDGSLEEADAYFSKAYEVTRSVGILIRQALMLPPVIAHGHDIATVRSNLESCLRSLLSCLPEGAAGTLDPVSAIERIHFYLVYHGLGGHDRVVQELVSRLYVRAWPSLTDIAPHCQPSTQHLVAPIRRPAKVGFISRFFGEKEPHGLLLEGILRHLPRSRFRVIVLVLPSHKGRISSEVVDSADEIHQLSLNFATVKAQVAALELDVLIFGEMNSEPLNHFLGYSRLAPVQMLFWGNPVTSGNPSIDYFISADVMESQRRTMSSPAEDVYSEQVVLLDGQGIWYQRPSVPTEWASRAELGFQEGWIVYLCAQSLFKMHPDMDRVFAEILRRDREGHLVFLRGKRPRWTEVFRDRLRAAGVDMQRVHFLPRVSAGDRYMQLLHAADVILHPFPFGGSRTSVEALLLGKPLVIMRNELLRGRMALSFYRTMGMTDCIANTPNEYVDLAVKLGRDRSYRASVESKILGRIDFVFSRLEVVYEWARLLARVTGQEPVSPTEVGFTSLQAYLQAMKGYANAGEEGWVLKETIDALDGGRGSRMSLDEDERSFRHDPDDGTYDRLIEYASRLRGMGEGAAAIAVWEEALQLRPSDAKVHNDVGAALQEVWRLEEAETHLRRAVELDPQYTLAMNNLAVTLHSMGRLDDAIEWYRASLRGATWKDSKLDLFLNNLGNLLRDRDRVQDAVDLYLQHLDLPDVHLGSGLAALLSLVDLKPHHEGPLRQLETQLRTIAARPEVQNSGQKGMHPDVTLLSLVERMRANQLSANSLVIALDRLGRLEPPAQDVLAYLSGSEEPPLVAAALNGSWSADSRGRVFPSDVGEVHLLVGYFVPSDPWRQKEVDLCLQQNLLNPYIRYVHLLLERAEDDPRPRFQSLEHKMRVAVIERRPTFAHAFMYANTRLDGHVCIIANADVFTDHTLARLFPPKALDLNAKVFALQRWELDALDMDAMTRASSQSNMDFQSFHSHHTSTHERPRRYNSTFHPRIDSQDAWILRAPVPDAVILNSEFELGRPRCDNRLAHVLRATGMDVQGPGFALRVHHVHYSTQKYVLIGESPPKAQQAQTSRPYGYTGEDQVLGEIAFVLLSLQWLF